MVAKLLIIMIKNYMLTLFNYGREEYAGTPSYPSIISKSINKIHWFEVFHKTYNLR